MSHQPLFVLSFLILANEASGAIFQINGQSVEMVGGADAYFNNGQKDVAWKLPKSAKGFQCHSMDFSPVCGVYFGRAPVDARKELMDSLKRSLVTSMTGGPALVNNIHRNDRDLPTHIPDSGNTPSSPDTPLEAPNAPSKGLSFELNELWGTGGRATNKASQLKMLIEGGAKIHAGSIKVIRGIPGGGQRVIEVSLTSEILLNLINLAEKGIGMKEALAIITSSVKEAQTAQASDMRGSETRTNNERISQSPQQESHQATEKTQRDEGAP